MTSDIEAPTSIRPALLAVGIAGLVLFVLAMPIYGLRFALTVALGTLLGLVNLYIVGRGVQGFLGGGSAGA